MRILNIHPKADLEYDHFVNRDRDTAYDVGNHLRVLECVVENGISEGLRPAYMEGPCSLYMFYGNRLQMFLSISGSTVLFAHLSELSSEYQQALALTEAIQRTKEHFEL